MFNLLIMTAVIYIASCVGIYINLGNYKITFSERLFLSVFSLIPVTVVLVFTAIEISKEKELVKTYRDKCFLLFVSFLAYADAIGILGEIVETKNKTKFKYYVPVREYPIQIKQKISRTLIAA